MKKGKKFTETSKLFNNILINPDKPVNNLSRTIEVAGKSFSVEIISPAKQKLRITDSDAEMDARANQAVKSAIAKAEFCKKPVARYDVVTQKAYVEFSDGKKKYVY